MLQRLQAKNDQDTKHDRQQRLQIWGARSHNCRQRSQIEAVRSPLKQERF
ncbi:MAG: hypothetical protein KME43_26000 [Myxacorys chilensis ATA2-1-KO14]|nr:hypothetical protein [Myxacorys chilensis ATA2-1-KO14]